MMKKYNLLGWPVKTRLKNHKQILSDPSPSEGPASLKSLWPTSLFLSLLLTLFLTQEITAQASFYTFAQSNQTYSSITGGTVITTSTSGTPNLDSYVSGNITIPSFTFAGFVYTAMFVTSNGQVALGTSIPSSSSTTVLSSTTGGNVFLAPFSGDLDDNTGVSEIRYEEIGNEFIVQWTNFRRYGRTESINFQVRMNTTTGVIKFVYDGTPPYDSSTVYQPQVGIKSAIGNYSALTVGAGGDWNSPVNITSGIVSGSTAAFTGSVGPTSGLTYTWTPNVAVIPNCASAFFPANLATNVERNPTLSWTSGGGNPTSYDVYFGSSTNPTFIGNQPEASYSPAFLAANTNYYWKIVPKNSTGEAVGCIERSFTTGSNVVYCTPSSTNNGTYINNFTTSLGSTNISNASVYTTGGYQDNYSATAVTSVPTGSFNFDMTVTGGTFGAAIWVDWNSDGTFETSERVFVTSSYSSGPFSGSITVPAGTASGDYRMRVMVDFNSTAPSNPCNTTAARTETEDYKITVGVQNVCSGTPAAATITSSLATICVSGSVTLTATIPSSTDSGFTYQWYNTTGAITGETASTFTTPVLSASESYYYKTTCTNSGMSSDSNTIMIAVTNPQVISTTPNSRCGEGIVALSATASSGATLNWYAEAIGGVSLATGNSFTTPSISTTTVFYVAASAGGSQEFAGKPTSNGTSGSFIGNGSGIVFNANSAVTLASTVIYPTGTGTVTIALYDNAGVELMSTEEVAVTGSGISTPVNVPLNFVVPVGTGYRLLLKSYTGITGLIRDSSGNAFPYSSSNVSVTDGYISGSSPAYYFFYNLQVATGCFSARTAVTATVDTPPALILSNTSSSICEGTSSATVTITTGASDYDTLTWLPNTGITGNAADGYVFNPTVTTTYTLTASQSTGSLCNIEVLYTVNVNQLPSIVTITPATAALCANEIQTLTATGGTIGTAGSIAIGTDTTLTIENSLEPTAFNNRYKHYWMQMVFTQAELNAAGIEAGSINGVKFEITTIGSAAFVSDYRVKMGSTTANVLTSFTTTGLTEVFNTATYTQVIGVNSIVFSTPYVWDGTSNIILDVRSTGADSANNAATYYTATTSNKTVSARTSSAFASSDAFAQSNPTGTLSVKRLNTTFDYSSSVPTEITWSPATNLFTDAAATVAYVSGSDASTVYVKSSTVGSQTYTATATSNPAGCETSSTVTVTTTETAPPTASAQSFCNSATVEDLAATGTDVQWYNVSNGGTPLANTAVLATGMYYASQTLNSCESTRTSVVVTVTTTAAPTASAQTVCTGATIADLVATGTDVQWYTALTGGTALANTAELVTGTYFASQTLNTCESLRTSVEVTVNALPTTTITRTDDTLTASEANATYQWVLCDASSTPIAGATSQSYTATAIGSYAVIVTLNDCTATSECFELNTLSTKTFDAAKLGYYPNPVTDVLTVSHTDIISGIQVFDITGRLVRNLKANSNEVLIDMVNMPASVYIVKVFTNSTSGEFKVIKK